MTSNTQIQKVEGFKALINTKEMFGRMKAACGNNKEAASQFMASMLDLYEGDNYLQGCDPNKIVMECMKAASLNLPLIKSLGYAYVVPYKGTATFVIGYKGLLQLALRSGQYAALNADCIYEGEEISFDRLSGKLVISGSKTSDKAIGYFAYFKLVNGFEKTLYMTVDELQAYGKRFSASYSKGPWQTDFDAMAKKTLIRRILKYGPMSTEMQKAELMEVHAAEAHVKADIDANANTVTIDSVAVDQETGEIIGAEPEKQTTPDF